MKPTKKAEEEFRAVARRLLEDFEDEDLIIFVQEFSKANAEFHKTKLEEEVKRTVSVLGALKLANFKLMKIKL